MLMVSYNLKPGTLCSQGWYSLSSIKKNLGVTLFYFSILPPPAIMGFTVQFLFHNHKLNTLHFSWAWDKENLEPREQKVRAQRLQETSSIFSESGSNLLYLFIPYKQRVRTQLWHCTTTGLNTWMTFQLYNFNRLLNQHPLQVCAWEQQLSAS